MILNIEYWLENNRVRDDDVKSRKNLACFQTYGNQAESTLVGRTFKLV